MAKEINLTYDTLFEILMREKNREELQKLDDGFLESVADYVAEKRAILASQEDKSDLFASKEREKLVRQLDNIGWLLTELYDKREKKLMNVAVMSSRTPFGIVDKSAMLDSEKRMFSEITSLLKKYRGELMAAALSSQRREIAAEPEMEKAQPQVEIKGPVLLAEEKSEEEVQALLRKISRESYTESQELKKRVLITHPVPKFVGKELEVYGPFNPDEEAELPSEIADILINKGRAKELTS